MNIPPSRLAYRRQGLYKIAESEDVHRLRRFLQEEGIDDTLFQDGSLTAVVKARLQSKIEENMKRQLRELKTNNQNMLRAIGIM